MPLNVVLILQNKEHGGSVADNAFIGDKASAEFPFSLMHNTTVYGGVFIGRYTYINVNTVVYPNTKIGRYCSIARNCEIGVAAHPTNWLSTHPFQFDRTIFSQNEEYLSIKKQRHLGHKDTVIGNDVWIGAKAVISSGVKVGDGSIIAAGAIVTKDVKPYEIVGGVPAKKIKNRFSPNTIKRLNSLQWWDLSLADLKEVDFVNIEKAISQIEELDCAVTQ